ncbi:copper chaperone PCu(A)C [Campylobacter sp. US33a]|uniref:Copper chaperone PCu(A)C n=1 Tax=Campylobacter sp. CCS1377 TaxID=3158229 RepID=A0AAU7E5X0_9BACT|nr:copper chaperone PCu(A)C [Campylobacter sp. US33a]TEY04081.1 copper chaperone PCu(A)C [Campylobacter sp. US33a]
MLKKYLFLGLFGVNFVFGANYEVSNAFVRENLPNSTTTAAFFTIKNNTNEDIKIVKATSNLSDVAELHTHKHEQGKMMMVQIPEILVKANSSTELKPGGLHIMILNLKENVTKDKKAELVLYFDNNQSLKVDDIEIKNIKMQ